MPVHKFGTKPKKWYNLQTKPKTIYLIPVMGLNHPLRKVQPVMWKFFNQNKLTINPKDSKTIRLRFGLMMISGMVLTTLKQARKMKQCSIQNEVILENVDDIVITSQTIRIAIPLKLRKENCYVSYIT